MLKHVEQNRDSFLTLYKDVLDGQKYSPRGLEIKEVRDYKFSIDPRYPFTSFKARNLNLAYLAAELLWYLRGDRFDLSICEYGSMWSTLIQKDGGLNSNYGQTIFGKDMQFNWVCSELVRDPDSRRAVFIIGEKDYLNVGVSDQRCCQYLQFMIRDNMLDCFAYFRSNDVCWGVSNDIFTLVEIYKYVYAVISQYLPKVKLGMYHHTATSMHVYSKHYDMLEKIIKQGASGFYEVPFCTTTNPAEFNYLAERKEDFPPSHFSYANRLLEMKTTGK